MAGEFWGKPQINGTLIIKITHKPPSAPWKPPHASGG
jgi:hypothetical protein